MWEVICSQELFSCLTTNSWTREDHCTRTIWKTAYHCLWMAHSQIESRCGGPIHEHCVGKNNKGRAVQSLVVEKKIKRVPGASEFIPKCVVSVTCSHLFACLHEPAEAAYHLLCLSLWCRDVQGMWCHRNGSSIPWELPAVMEPTKNLLFVLWLLPQVSHPSVSLDW
jgi:hypothetical protein